MGDIYISGNGRRSQENNGQDIPIQRQRVNPQYGQRPVQPQRRPVSPQQGQQQYNSQQRRPVQQNPQQRRPVQQNPQQRRPVQQNYQQRPVQQRPQQQRMQQPQRPNGQNNGGRPPQQNQQVSSKKHMPKFIKVLVCLVLVAAVAFSAAFSMIYSTASKIDYDENGHQDNIYVNASNLMHDRKVTNILLLGVDGKSTDNALRSDTMLLVSIDRNNKKIKLTSFLRDTWVLIPSSQKYAKLNAACAYGGPQLVMDTIEYNYNVKIDHFMLVGFDMFKTIIDSFGGVNVEVTEKEADFMRRTAKPTRNIKSGPSVHMNGSQALVYCRIRKLDSDFMRTFRQRKVISALIGQAKESSFSDLKNVADNVLSMIQTDVSPFELTKLALGVPKYITYDVESERIPKEGTYSYKRKSGQDVIVADLDENREFLNDYLYSQDPVEEDTAA